ncbi:hypothetical protein HDU93_002485 [Gonapodya sp. JEL0774]|nr:hypothetical protein HDU93_002485 [Gonapodya sp. JEL0774]
MTPVSPILSSIFNYIYVGSAFLGLLMILHTSSTFLALTLNPDPVPHTCSRTKPISNENVYKPSRQAHPQIQTKRMDKPHYENFLAEFMLRANETAQRREIMYAAHKLRFPELYEGVEEDIGNSAPAEYEDLYSKEVNLELKTTVATENKTKRLIKEFSKHGQMVRHTPNELSTSDFFLSRSKSKDATQPPKLLLESQPASICEETTSSPENSRPRVPQPRRDSGVDMANKSSEKIGQDSAGMLVGDLDEPEKTQVNVEGKEPKRRGSRNSFGAVEFVDGVSHPSICAHGEKMETPTATEFQSTPTANTEPTLTKQYSTLQVQPRLSSLVDKIIETTSSITVLAGQFLWDVLTDAPTEREKMRPRTPKPPVKERIIEGVAVFVGAMTVGVVLGKLERRGTRVW